MLATSDTAHISRHKCLIYDGDPSEQLPVIVPLLKEGLSSKYRCLYLGAPEIIEMVRKALTGGGIDVGTEEKRGALVFSADRSYLDDGGFQPQAMIDGLVTMIDDAVRDGFAGLCATGDMRWELGDDDSAYDKLLEYEALLEQVFHTKPLMGICQYHRGVLPAHTVRDALLTHRSTWIGDTLNRDNLFYIPPELALQSRTSVDPVKHGEWMYHQITRVLKAEDARDKALNALRTSEAELASANRDLEKRVRERTAELEAANHQLESFSYSVSHDLRAPVRTVKGFSEILAEEFKTTLGAEGMHYVNRIDAGAQRMEELIEGMLALSGAVNQPMHSTKVDLTALANDVVRELTESAPGRSVKVSIESGLTAPGDRTLLRIVVANLIGNAWKFTSKRVNAKIEVVSGGLLEGMRVFCVRDNGAGFDASKATSLFEPFRRMHTDTEFAGTGVGLATVQRVIQRHGGRIWVESSIGNGATFYFALPAE